MIVFDLSCECGCQFEGWFHDSSDFHRQEKEGLLACPDCSGNIIKKIMSPVAVRSASRCSSKPVPVANTPEKLAANLLKTLQDYVVNNYEDVGTGLVEESLKIHYGVKKPRNIRGVSSENDEKILREEGIDFIKILLPAKSDKN